MSKLINETLMRNVTFFSFLPFIIGLICAANQPPSYVEHWISTYLFHPNSLNIEEWRDRQIHAVMNNDGSLPPCPSFLPNYMPHAILFSSGPLSWETNLSMAVKNAKQFVETILLSFPFDKQREIITHIRNILCEKQKTLTELQLVMEEIWEPQYRAIVFITDPLAINLLIDWSHGYSPQVAFREFINTIFLKLLPIQQAFVLKRIVSKFSATTDVITKTFLMNPASALSLLELLQSHCELLEKHGVLLFDLTELKNRIILLRCLVNRSVSQDSGIIS